LSEYHADSVLLTVPNVLGSASCGISPVVAKLVAIGSYFDGFSHFAGLSPESALALARRRRPTLGHSAIPI
jgi:hypothetical protein